MSEAGIAQLATSRLGNRLEIFELHRNDISVTMAERIIAMPSLHMLVCSRGFGDNAKRLLVAHFGKRGVVCDDEVEDAIRLGARRVTFRRLPSP